MESITDLIQIKNMVLKVTAEYAFKRKLYSDYEQIPYELIQGIKPKFRCCVYREREIIRQRVRMAMGKLPMNVVKTDSDSAQVVHVIPSACEGCPISKISVTSNCQSCLAKKCEKACPFGAITSTPNGAVIDYDKCRKCGKCVEACPYNAIVEIERPCIRSCPVKAINMDENDIATIDLSKCINCGNCVVGCPFGAISDVSMMTNVIDALLDTDKEVVAMIAPSIEGQFGEATLSQIKKAIQKLGFSDVYEVALGADMVAYHEAAELLENKEAGKPMTSSCCPAFVNLIRKHYPKLEGYISNTVSPMVAVERYIRTQKDNVVTVFIGPCIAKKNEVMGHYVDEIDYVLTFEELYAMLSSQGVVVEDEPDEAEDASRYGKGFALAGGVTAAVEQVLKEQGSDVDITVQPCSGAQDCRKTLLMLNAGKLKADFVEGMFCSQGCMGGPATLEELKKSKKVIQNRLNGAETVVDTVQGKGLDNTKLNRR
jgi:ferredoxin hydrogenase large subunit